MDFRHLHLRRATSPDEANLRIISNVSNFFREFVYFLATALSFKNSWESFSKPYFIGEPQCMQEWL